MFLRVSGGGSGWNVGGDRRNGHCCRRVAMRLTLEAFLEKLVVLSGRSGSEVSVIAALKALAGQKVP